MISLNEIQSAQIFLFVFAALGGGIALPLLLAWDKKIARNIGALLCLTGSIAAAFAAILPLVGNPSPALSLGAFPSIGKLYFELDALSGFFAAIVSVVGAAVSVYSFRYMDEYSKKGYDAGLFWALLSLFILSMIAVVAAKNAILFMVSWEVMALSSYLLVTYESREEGVKGAGFIYLLIAHLGAAMLIAMFLILAGISGGSLDFADFAGAHIPELAASAIFVLALLGFGSKAGIIPLHIWLPQAHPQAPSGISAMMSGVMLKVAVYGFIRVAFGFLGGAQIPLWWGISVIALGAVSALLGVLYALIQHDLKRMLAYHSIENIGIIFIGIGAALLFSSTGNEALAALALFAAIYHSLNHALFKSVLFMGAGAVIHSIHTRDIEKMGGLAKFMPFTAVMFFIASYAISAVPPLNGFVSEWLTFQSLVAGANAGGYLQLVFGIVAISLALTSALALAAFVKVFGIVFLGLPRSEKVQQAKEAPGAMLAAMAVIAAACIATGIFPSMIAGLAAPALASVGFGNATQAYSQADSLPMLEIFALLLASAILIALLVSVLGKAFNAKHETRITWDCGYYTGTPRMQYTASGFSMPIMRIFGKLVEPVETKHHGGDFFEEFIYKPIYGAYAAISSKSSFLQTGQLPSYLLYMMLTLIGVLIYALL